MGQRLQLHDILKVCAGNENVYFQPPANVQMKYPCILYNREPLDTRYADNRPYRHVKKYQVTIIDRNPDSEIPNRVAELPMSSHVRTFVADNLNHDVFDLYY
jgi:hypothetical protein